MVDLSRMKKHTGILSNTGVRCVVVFREIPTDESMCLIVETERLPDMYHDNIIECVNSKEAQDTNDFHTVLNRRTLSDGTNALQALHYKKFLRKVPVSSVTLLPFPGQSLPLELLNAQLAGTTDEYKAKEEAKEAAAKEEEYKANPMSDPDDVVSRARGLLVQAELLEAEAARKRVEAHELAPELDSEKKRGRPPLSAEEKAIRTEERKIKRRERDRAKAAEKKEAAAEASLTDAVDSKIVRDAALKQG